MLFIQSRDHDREVSTAITREYLQIFRAFVFPLSKFLWTFEREFSNPQLLVIVSYNDY